MDGREFEILVRQTARWVWNLPPGEGASDFIKGYEIDCVCRTQDLIHLVECTIERRLQKVKDDCQSLNEAKRHLESQGQTVKPWIITLDEPTSDQQAYARNHKVTILSYSQFRTRLLRSEDYLNARWNYRFGSVADPRTGSSAVHEEEYVPVPLKEAKTGLEHDIASITNLLVKQRATVVLEGPFGAGKSLTVREIFKYLRLKYFKDSQTPVAVAMNLRDHWGQDDTDEALRRHSAKVGFEGRDQLVRAWNAGFVVLLLDGFDELASQAWRIAPANMRKTRSEAVRLVRAFVRDNSGRFGILLTGREHYFDTTEEMYGSLALPNDAVVVEIEEFTEEQAQSYLKKKGVTQPLPDWLPRKPLLLGYLAAQNLLKDVLSIDGTKGAAYAWDVFLDKICEREATLSKDIEGASVRKLLEVLAAKSRASLVGAGPLVESDLASAYARVTGSEPLEEARTLLQRLPGLTSRDQQEGARSFVDVDMLEALRGSGVARYISSPYSQPEADNWRHPMGNLGHSVAALCCQKWSVKIPTHFAAAAEASNRWESPTLAIDCLLSAASRDDVGNLDCGGLAIKEALIDSLDFETYNLSNLELQYCHIRTLDIGDAHPNNIKVMECLIDKIVGIPDATGLPSWILRCEVGHFDNLHTNASIMRCGAPMPVRVLLTILRKLFIQRGRARRESAFSRGIEPNATRFVSQILDLVRKGQLAFSIPLADGPVWHPNRRHQGRVRQIISSLGTNDDPIVLAVSKLK